MNHLAKRNAHKTDSLGTHTPPWDERWLDALVCGSFVLDCTTLPIVVSLDPRALSSMLERAHLLQWL